MAISYLKQKLQELEI